MPTALDNGQRTPKKLLRAVVARLLGRKALECSLCRSQMALTVPRQCEKCHWIVAPGDDLQGAREAVVLSSNERF
jgi:hypothetical protein